MPLHTRPYADDDLPALQAALAAWTTSAGVCGYCHIGELPHRIYENLRGRLPVGELVHVWEDAGRVAGVAICGRFGAAFDLFAAPELRGTGQERAMLEAACATTGRLMGQLGAEGQPVITDVFGCDDVRKAQLAALGFAPYRQWDDIAARALDSALPEVRLPEGFAVRCVAPGDYAQLAAARNAAFGADWSPEQYRDEVMRKPGYAPERELVVAAPDGQIVAFTVIWLDALNRTGLFEPVGTHPDFQRQGLARALMAAALREMRRQGMRSATVAHDATNQAARALYRSLGFQKTDETLGYQRPV